MQLNITGHHLEVTPALREHIEEKLDRIRRHGSKISNTHVVLNVEKGRHTAEIQMNVEGAQLVANCESDDMYRAIDSMTDKLDRQIIKHKEKHLQHNHGQGH
ncbi:ribosome hibernation-promoting factor, HPF/YfiA family [Pelagibaculum spongiae]|uniref:Ribosome hibernation promoting factor n=1 Tax=Pelagibaculum spongiae TaxID=2080658 RepID=A0A2V1H0D0_9GAMM|nr:ribosome-associated translation inhibitor RaiA [Pelagibaculum spongiae]PVZ71923.1 ribosome-associated translation inhibitor RaiA [Pelagibaculum spongiae]